MDGRPAGHIRDFHLKQSIDIAELCRVSTHDQWPFQEPKLEVPTIYKAYVRPM